MVACDPNSAASGRMGQPLPLLCGMGASLIVLIYYLFFIDTNFGDG